MKKSAFTLIELLVVISIIAILASLAIPAYTKVMEKGKVVQDANNLRQLGLGIVQYTTDNNDSYFPGSPGTGGSGASWVNSINPKFVPVWKVFQSPFDKRIGSESGATAPVSPISYDFNTWLLGANTTDVTSPSNCVLLSIMTDPSTTSPSSPKFSLDASKAANLFGKLTKTSNQVSNAPFGVFNSNKMMNVLFADSHVASVKASVYFTSGTGFDPNWNH